MCANSENKRVGERLKKFLKSQKIKNINVAHALGITSPAITGWINGRNVMSANIILSLSHIYKLNPTWLITGSGPMLLPDQQEYTQQPDKLPLPTEINIRTISDQLRDAHLKLIECQEKLIKLQDRCINCPKKDEK